MKKEIYKKHVEDHRSDFEVHGEQEMLDSLWSNIDQELDRKQRSRTWGNVLKVAASIILIMVAGFALLRVSIQQQFADGIALNEVSSELAETEYFYFQQIQQKMEILQSSQNEIDPEILKDLALLDSAYSDLKKDLAENMDNQEVINAMIENYRIKLMMLEQILEQMEIENEQEDSKIQARV